MTTTEQIRSRTPAIPRALAVSKPDAEFHAQHGPADHGQAQDPVDVAHLPVPDGGDDRFARDMGHIDARGHVAREIRKR